MITALRRLRVAIIEEVTGERTKPSNTGLCDKYWEAC
jgi:hypothetical protein